MFQVNSQRVPKHTPQLGKSEPSNLKVTEAGIRVAGSLPKENLSVAVPPRSE